MERLRELPKVEWVMIVYVRRMGRIFHFGYYGSRVYRNRQSILAQISSAFNVEGIKRISSRSIQRSLDSMGCGSRFTHQDDTVNTSTPNTAPNLSSRRRELDFGVLAMMSNGFRSFDQ